MLSRESEIILKAVIEARRLNDFPDDIFIKRITEILSELDEIPVKIYCENPECSVPQYAHEGEDACMDLRAQWIERKVDRIICHTGVYIELPPFHQLNIYPRSGLTKTDWYIANTPGIGDSGYRGEILVVFRPIHGMDREAFPYKEGERVAQCQVVYAPNVKWQIVKSINDLAPSKRGIGGYGSTGKQ